ncbi:unnamed protein product [Protopolystoma xenopodis]|uniref:Uncharacterized protein n=1 Tax=Protopolystoma xenopodis TaxID=117903 RepID=A0A3S5BBZ5_9PLAT|nr:unnamed protein product [Protopolystoma xenopodis]
MGKAYHDMTSSGDVSVFPPGIAKHANSWDLRRDEMKVDLAIHYDADIPTFHLFRIPSLFVSSTNCSTDFDPEHVFPSQAVQSYE